ncbi:hypothetical protein AUJ66_00820 [Candidatus Desantisbacteria bacterium CG1_02_38_46]|uniref:CdsD C-terminal domain-containing protein n=3 Tax=unclassified Candidatus Desantisiibacteriota TaxID=3106372 RepID=A0A2H9PCE5_9BACT|nr:MAG: hypothetical protein AUJ66_00820 [Candidatus Desantisbacteria bacterium CG1_02_38_46]PIU51871.1 MAG: hypothetical protein COS91_02175 [Candidatus Desantisbacteria bacterium CG07_land_8_20_14_0_80_39_15]PIZ16826.1 MAG: hypothetical protein COY51_01840 [Candidatus Desantisbacteria bacterium CG_4_10_14_0_8_um_filter_39_17]
MNPRLKKLIIIGNIVAYVIICLVIYARRKGGFKAFLPRKKMSLEEVIAKQKGPPVPTAPLAVKPSPEVTMAELPAHIRDARKLLDNMRIKEQTLKFNYYSLNRDPFVSLVGIENYLSQTKFTPDEYSDLPPGLPVKEKQKSSPFTLFGTIKSRDGKSSAIINGQVLEEGDIIDGYKVTKIEKKSITLTSGKKVIHLKMLKNESKSETAVLQRLKEIKQ